jgi:quercetin dioxygenase-like cupin family protein
MEQGDFFFPLRTLEPPPELKDIPGAQTWLAEGARYGMVGSSLMIAQVAPGDGPPLHLHFSEEVQYVLEGHLRFQIGDKIFEVSEPGVVHIPANTPHAFINIGDTLMRVVTFFPTSSYEMNWKVLGPNPLQTKSALLAP